MTDDTGFDLETFRKRLAAARTSEELTAVVRSLPKPTPEQLRQLEEEDALVRRLAWGPDRAYP